MTADLCFLITGIFMDIVVILMIIVVAKRAYDDRQHTEKVTKFVIDKLSEIDARIQVIKLAVTRPEGTS